MAVFSEPTKWAQSLGATANADVIPDVAGATDVDISKIFPAVFSVPLSQGGKAIPRRTLNGILKLLGDWIYYIQNGGIASYSTSFDYAVGRVVLYNSNLYKCIQANGASGTVVAPTNTTYWVKVVTLADFANLANTDLSNLSQTGLTKIIPTSTILPFAGSTVPNGWLLCNGAGISRSTYSNLFAKIGTTYGKGDGSTTFNIPDLRDRYIIGANTNTLGTKVAEQLPNITGDCSTNIGANDWGLFVYAAGAYYLSGSSGTLEPTFTNPTSSVHSGIGLTAHNANAIYTNGGKVYPASLALNFIIKT